MMKLELRSISRHPSIPASLFGALLLAAGCTGDDGERGPAGPAGPAGGSGSELDVDEDAPGVQVEILSIDGASGAGGAFQVGDRISFTFTLQQDDGTDWDITEFSRARALVSGPTFNYQRVLAEVQDLDTMSVQNADGSYTYTFADPIPATYLPPLNDTASFDADDGELTGNALLSGTYTVGAYFGWDYEAGDEEFRDVGNATADFLFGSANTLAPRSLVAQDNCNRCHETLQAHGGLRRDVTLCLLCHNSGAEDRNTMTAAGGTPGVTIDFKVMIHKIHNGKHLPSVLGMATNPDGSRNYAATPQPYQVVGFRDSIHDYSDVAFPVWPSLSFPMPRDAGYSALGGAAQDLEDEQRSGVVSCQVCHGDPDGSGPLMAPDDGQVAFQQPSRNACGSCHDDVDWTQPYMSNTQTMPAQMGDGTCTQCHPQSGSALAVQDAHEHPMFDPDVNPGVNFELVSVEEAGTNDMDGTLDPGEKVAITFNVTDDMGMDTDPADVSLNVAMAGPTDNMNILLSTSIPSAALSGMQPYTLNLPQRVFFELVGTSSSGMLEAFGTARTPVWTAGASTEVYFRSGDSTMTMLASAAGASQNYIDVEDASGLDRDDYVVIDDGTMVAEYLQIQWVDDDRVWFGSTQQSDYPPGLVYSHSAGAGVLEVTLDEMTEGMDYTLDAMTGTVTETAEFGDGDVVVSYTSDMIVPDVYPSTLNDSPDLEDGRGDWAGKSLVSGTYKVTMWGNLTNTLMLFGESNTYRGPGVGVSTEVLVGDATTVEPYDLISSGDNCLACHQELIFHGGSRRGFETCIVCHGTSGAEDRPPYRAPNAPATTGVEVRFREMIHKIHMGEELANASSYQVIGFGSGFPNNFSAHMYDEVVFPALPDGPKDCAKCHGDGNEAWTMPTPVSHPTEQLTPPQPWTAACGACHDGDAAQAHIAAQTAPSGAESCSVCHEESGELSIPVVHKVR